MTVFAPCSSDDFDKYVDKIIQFFQDDTTKEGRDWRRWLNGGDSQIDKNTLWKISQNENEIRPLEVKEWLTSHYYVCSLCQVGNVDEMWEGYADDHKGVVLSLDTDKLIEVYHPEELKKFCELDVDVDFVAKVKYMNEMPCVNPLELIFDHGVMLNVIMTKLKDVFEKEQEVRCVAPMYSLRMEKGGVFRWVPKRVIDGKERSFIFLPRIERFLYSIRFGSKFAENEKETIYNIFEALAKCEFKDVSLVDSDGVRKTLDEMRAIY